MITQSRALATFTDYQYVTTTACIMMKVFTEAIMNNENIQFKCELN